MNNHTVRDSSGFIVSVRDIHFVDYTEGVRTCTVEIEGGVENDNEQEWHIYSSSLTGWKDTQDNPMSMPMMKEILQRISSALVALGMRNRIV